MTGEHVIDQAIPPAIRKDAAVNSPDGQERPTAPRGTAEPEAPLRGRPPADSLITIREIRQLFGLGRTAAYELTHRPGFPAPVPVSARCYRWWAGEVAAFAAALRTQSRNPRSNSQRRAQQRTLSRDPAPLRITGTVRVARSRRGSRGPDQQSGTDARE